MKKIIFSTAIFALAFTSVSYAQLNAVKKVNTKVNEANATVTNTVFTIDNAKNTLKNIFGQGKKSGTILIAISGIDFDNQDLTTLKKNIEDIKGVKSSSKSLNSGSIILEVVYKGKPENLWDGVSKEAKVAFKLLEIGESNLSLEYKSQAL